MTDGDAAISGTGVTQPGDDIEQLYLYYDPGAQRWVATEDTEWMESAAERHGFQFYRVDEMTPIDVSERYQVAGADQ